MDIHSDVCPLRALVVDYAFGLAAIPWLWHWGSLAAAEYFWTEAEEWAEARGEMMASVQRIPPEMMIGHCAVCGEGFQYSRAHMRPPKTCGMWACMVKAREEVAT